MQGRDKLTEFVDGIPLLRRIVLRALEVGEVIVTLPVDSNSQVAVDGLPVVKATVPDAVKGMSASIKAGLKHVPKSASGVMILPADMPELTADDLRLVAHQFELKENITRGASKFGTAGHPVIFPRSTFEELNCLEGDEGARSVLRDRDVTHVTLPDCHATVDLDTPEDWDAWRKSQQAKARTGS
jgi:molybdenum cofactor cytidylyltransferase